MANRRLLLAVLMLPLGACACTSTAQHVLDNVILPEQRTLPLRDPSQLPPSPIPPVPPPPTVSNPRPGTKEWQLSLDEAIRIALVNAKVIRVLAGVTAQSAGRTIYDSAILNTNVDVQQARFDPVLGWQNTWTRTDTPQPIPDPFDPARTLITGNRVDDYRSLVTLDKTNVLGGTWSLRWTEEHMRFGSGLGVPFPLNPQDTHALELGYTQPLLQGGGFAFNTAPIAIARLDTERSFYEYKDTVQELVRGVIEAYWNLVQARTDVWARERQVEQSREALDLAEARRKTGFAALTDVAQARVTYNQFRSNLIASRANVLAREGALRNLLMLPAADGRQIVPTSAPATRRLGYDWDRLLALAGERRPEVVAQKLVIEADRQRLVQAENRALPRLDAMALYRWHGLSGVAPNGERVSTEPGEFADWTLGLNFSLPVGRREGRALVRQQELTLARDGANLEQTLHAAAALLASTVRDVDSAYEQYLALKETREAALENLRAQQAAFLTARVIYLNVLQAINDWGNAVSAEAQALLTYNVALATLERQTGTILETHGLVFYEERFVAAGPLCHDRSYPSATPPAGKPHVYPGTGEPSENTFDLRKPEIPRLPPARPEPPATLDPPRPLP